MYSSKFFLNILVVEIPMRRLSAAAVVVAYY